MEISNLAHHSVQLTKKGEAYCAIVDADGVFFLTLTRDRQSIATTIERLIHLLDTMDGDENLEECGGAEPWLGWTGCGAGPKAHVKGFPHHLDLESDLGVSATYTDAGIQYDLEGDTADAEPWLGTPERHDIYCYGGIAQIEWAQGCSNDAETNGDEDDYDGGERDFPMLIPGGNELSAT